ncbi:protein TALPID3-like isoform X2 [Myxocyprinus asiaticus]|uniref:protein TALPID3-like isoform X2 n=1 Tax=Myxocyprinus asiaticus TaxID=70543 RepID=UPI002223B2F6|nr:protein TALPID3-like isoform X2 [Myxocyprinus asiaticus]
MDSCVSVTNNTQLNDSSSSSDAADVLIRSTRAAFNHTRVETHYKSYNKDNINIRRLSDFAHVTSGNDGCTEEISLVLPVNLPASDRGAEGQQTGGSSKQVADLIEKSQLAVMQAKKNSKSKGEDVEISRYSTDGRGAVSAALKKRYKSAPLRRNVTVQVLDQDRPQTPKGQPDPGIPPGDSGTSENVAAITAATIAATFPLIKAQSEMEAQISRVTAELKRLQAAEASVKHGRAGSTVDCSAERAAHLEEQLNVLIQQRLQHLETIQCQQIQLQNRLLGSALDVVTARANADTQTNLLTSSVIHQTGSLPTTDKTSAESSASVSKDLHRERQTGGHKSPLETPAPRKVIPKPTYWTSSTKTIKSQKTSSKNQGNGRLQDQTTNNQRSPERCSMQSSGLKRIAIATAENAQPEQSRHRQTSSKASFTPTRSDEPEEPALMKPHSQQENKGEQIYAPSSSSAVHRANEMLQDLGRLKDEMRTLLQTADAFPVQNAKSTQNSRSSYLSPSTMAPPPSTTPISMPAETVDPVAVRAVPLNRPSILKSIQSPTSMFEDAGLVLRQVRQSRKVLEENLEAILRAENGEVLHSQLEALSKNRDVSEEVRIKKTVDAWINTLSKEIQDELVRESSDSEKKIVERSDAAVSKVLHEGQGSRSGHRAGPRGGGGGGGGGGRGGGNGSAAGRKTSVRGSVRAQAENTLPHGKQHTLSVRTKPESSQETAEPVVLKSQADQEYLAKLYGKALYEGHRRTLKKGPYLRFNSPSPKSKTQRPKVIETVKGVKMKSSKTQTSQFVDGASALQSSVSEPHFLFRPSDPDQQQQPGSPVRCYLIPMAIPLGKPRVDSQAPLPSRVIISNKAPTVTTSFPPITIPKPKPASAIRKPNTILLEVQSEPKKRTPQLEIQVQPCVNIESALCSRLVSSLPSIPADTILPPPTVYAAEDPHAYEDQDENGFPGTNFLAVADISQETHIGVPDSPIELNGLPSPPAALYHGPAFPPQPSQSTPLTEPILNNIQQKETLENRLVDWVEQQLMARMITGMFPQPTQADPASQSEPDESATSDIVETAGGGGLQLFVDTGVPVDSELIRQCVNEVLAETIAVMLGQRETQRVPTAIAQTQESHTQEEVTTVPTPIPTPEPSVKEPTSPVRTPDLSEHLSMALSAKENQHQESASPGPDKIPVDTPATTPIPSPTRVATPSHPPANQSPDSASLQNHPWAGTELPLKEEDPHSEREEQQPPLVVMSVAREDEEEESTIPPSSPLNSKLQTPPPPLLPAPVSQEPPLPPAAASSESPSTEESSSSSSVTVTETAARHISEGELLLTHSQMAAVRVLEEEGVILPNLLTSLNSSLLGVQDMDYDPPSEGQVIRAPLLPAHHDPILSLLARMEHGPVSQSQQPERWWEEESSGEISEGQRPPLSAAEESVLTGHSLIDQQRYTQNRNTDISPHATLTSPGQVLAKHTGQPGVVVQDSGMSINLRLPEEPKELTVSSPQPEDAAHQQSTETTQVVHRPAPILVRQYQDKEEPDFPQQRRLSNDTFFEDNVTGEDIFLHTEGRGSDVRVMSVRLPSVNQEHESGSVSSVEGDPDFSANDVF